MVDMSDTSIRPVHVGSVLGRSVATCSQWPTTRGPPHFEHSSVLGLTEGLDTSDTSTPSPKMACPQLYIRIILRCIVSIYSCSLGRLVCPWPCRGSRHDRHAVSTPSDPVRHGLSLLGPFSLCPARSPWRQQRRWSSSRHA